MALSRPMSLASARVDAELTQEEVCAVLEISKNTLLNYEKYRTSPDMDTAKKMAGLYQRPVEDIRWNEA